MDDGTSFPRLRRSLSKSIDHQRSAGDRWIWIKTAEGVEMTFRRPYGGKIMGVSELRPFEQQAIFLRRVARFIRRKVKQAEIKRPRARRMALRGAGQIGRAHV